MIPSLARPSVFGSPEYHEWRATWRLWHNWPIALFYVCKAMGPPRVIAWRRGAECEYPIAARDPVESAAWWAWFDAAQAWVDGIV